MVSNVLIVHCHGNVLISILVGMNLSFNFGSGVVTVPSIDQSGLFYSRYLEGCSFNVNSPSSTIAINGLLVNASKPPVTVSYASTTQAMSWSSQSVGVGHVPPIPNTGTADAVFNLGGTAQCATSSANHPNELSLSFTFDETFTVSVQAQSQSFWQEICGGQDTVPQEYLNLSPVAPSISLSLPPLDYYLTTNLILPGKYVFIADPPVASSDNAHGLASPRDTILTGQINMNAVAAARRSKRTSA